jgi:hypothetical protein
MFSSATLLATYDPADYLAGITAGSTGVDGSVNGANKADYFAYFEFTGLPAGGAFTYFFQPSSTGTINGQVQLMNSSGAEIAGTPVLSFTDGSQFSASGTIPNDGSIIAAVLDPVEQIQFTFSFTLVTPPILNSNTNPKAPEPGTFGAMGLALAAGQLLRAVVSRRRPPRNRAGRETLRYNHPHGA